MQKRRKSQKSNSSPAGHDGAVVDVLVIGATGRTGLACIHSFATRKGRNHVRVHAFCRDVSNLSKSDAMLCNSLVEGDATNEDDVRHALKKTKASCILICIGNSDINSTDMVRSKSAKAIVNVMKRKQFKKVRAVVISRVGKRCNKKCATPTSCYSTKSNPNLFIGLGIRKIIEHRLRQVLKDHAGQESEFQRIAKRVTIVRPLGIREIPETGIIKEVSGDIIYPIGRVTAIGDLAHWITEEVTGTGSRTHTVTGRVSIIESGRSWASCTSVVL